MKKILLALIFILLFSMPVYASEREIAGGLDEDIEIINIEDFDGNVVVEKQLPESQLNIERPQGKPQYEDIVMGAIGFDNNNLRAYWDQFTDNYIYNQLTPEEKNLWNNLDDIYFEYLTTTKDFTTNTALITINDYSYDQLYDMGRMYRYAHPQYYFLRPRFAAIRRIQNGEVRYALTINFYDKFKDGTERAIETIKVRNKLEEWGKILQKCTSDYDKAKTAHDLICNKISYDKEVIADNYNWKDDPNFSQTMYSVLCRDKTVCAGYAICYTCLLNYTGLNNTAVVGGIGSGHAWNMVAINDTWYNVDVCWDDGDNPYYKYFLVSDQFTYNGNDYHYKYDYYKPYISIAYKNYNGFESYNEDTWYHGTSVFQFGAKKINYNFGRVRIEDISGYNNLTTEYWDIINYNMKLPEISRKGYKFAGWYLDNITKVTKLASKNNYNTDLNIYAHWGDPIKYKIEFNKGVFTKKEKSKVKGKTKAIKNIKYDEAVTLTECGFTYPGYKFIGWTTVKNGTTVEYLDAQRVSNLSTDGKAVKLYAVWQKE